MNCALKSVVFALLLVAACPLGGQTAEPAKPAAMAADADPAFEVATIKPTAPDTVNRALNLGGRTFEAKNFSLNQLIVFGYSLHAKQVLGTTGWMDTEHFDVTGVPDQEGQPSNAQWRAMVRKLLAMRFQMAVHHEQRELDVYGLGVAKSGPKMTKNESGKPGPGSFNFRFTHDGQMVSCKNESIPELVQTMALIVVDRPMLDRTGLTGRFDFTFTFAPDGGQINGAPMSAPSLFTAMQDELGLKLEAVKAPVDTVVVDHAERPSAN